jgi:predicted PurR-regulated permease PerM
MTGPDRLVAILVVLAAAFLLYRLAPILTPFIASALLAYLGDPLVDRLERLRLPRTAAVLLVFVLLFVGLGALTLLIIPLVRTQAVAFATELPSYVAWIQNQLVPRINDLFGFDATATNVGFGALVAQYSEELRQLAGGALRSVSRSGGVVVTAVLNVALVPVITFYLLRDWDLIMARIAALIPEQRRPGIVALARRTDEVFNAFLRGQLLVMLGLAVIYSVGLWWVRLDFALAIGVLAGLVSFVPYLGLIVGIALASMAALVQLHSLAAVGGVVLVFVVGQLIEGTVLTPNLVGTSIGLHPVVVIFAVLAGGQLFGFIGILLALPAAAVMSVLVRFAFEHYRTGGHGAATDNAAGG